MVPFLPQTHPVETSIKLTPRRSFDVPLVNTLQFPSVLVVVDVELVEEEEAALVVVVVLVSVTVVSEEEVVVLVSVIVVSEEEVVVLVEVEVVSVVVVVVNSSAFLPQFEEKIKTVINTKVTAIINAVNF
jgi:hypothetical protein